MRLHCLLIVTLGLSCLLPCIVTETITEPSDCVVYPVLHHPRTAVVKTFRERVKVSFRVPTGRRGKTSIGVTILLSALEKGPAAISSNCSLEFRVTSSQKTTTSSSNNAHVGDYASDDSSDYIRGHCNRWTGSPNGSHLGDTIHSNLIKFQDWSNLLIAVDAHGSLVVTSMDAHDVEIVKFENSGLSGAINLEIISEEERVEVMFNCVSNCELRFGGHEYHSTLGYQFFYWRTTPKDSLEVRHRSFASKFSIVVDEAVEEGADNWVTVLIDVDSKTFNWSIPGTSLWRTTSWSLGNIRSNFEMRRNVDFRVQKTALVTNCHPLQLPCPSNPFSCQTGMERITSVEKTARIKIFDLSTAKGAIPLIVIILLLVTVVVLSFAVCRLRRARSRQMSMEMRVKSKENQTRTSSVFPIKIKQDPYGGEGNIYDEYVSEFPLERVNNTYTSEFFKPKDKCEKHLYYNVNSDAHDNK